MSLVRYGIKKYAVVEINKISAPDTNRVHAKLPLSKDATVGFTAEKPCENGMWLVYDQVAGTAHKPTAVTDPVALMYLNEKEYEYPTYGALHDWALVPDSYCPRVYFNAVGDTYTTNCFCYDDSEFDDDSKVDEALSHCADTPIYLVPGVNEGAPQLTKTLPSGAVVACQVVKDYTLPNGDHGIKVAYIKAC